MAIKKTTKVKPYNPLSPYGNHSLGWYQQQANTRAQSDINAQTAALPSEAWLRDSSGQLAKALGGIQQNQTNLAAAGGGLYQQAFQDASNPANRAAMVAGGTGVSQTPGGQSLQSVLGAMLAGSMGGAQQAAVARGEGDVANRAKQVSAAQASMPSLAQKYLDSMKQEQLSGLSQSLNNQLAQQQFGLNASNTAFDNNLAASNTAFDNNLAAANLDQKIASSSANASAKKTAARSKERAAKLKEVKQQFDKWTKPTKKQTGNTYTYQPNIVNKATGSLMPSFEVQAANGSDAVNLAIKKLTALGVQGVSGTQVGSWLKSTKPVYGQAPSRTSRQAYKNAVDILANSGFTRKEAIRLMRQYAGVSTSGPLEL